MIFFVKAIANKMRGDLRGLQSDDLEQVGMIAVIRSLPTYDADKGSFQSRAWQWALVAMEREIYDNLSLIRLPKGGGNGKQGAPAIVAQIKKLETADTVAIAEEIGVSERRVRSIYNLLHGHLSLDSGRDGEAVDLPDDGENPESIAIMKEEMSNFERILTFFRSELTDKETIIFDNCIVADEEDRITVTQAAAISGVPRSTAYWTYNRLLSRLRLRLGRR
jgi:RNA polymerase sigma factor (sigma-70 family)